MTDRTLPTLSSAARRQPKERVDFGRNDERRRSAGECIRWVLWCGWCHKSVVADADAVCGECDRHVSPSEPTRERGRR